jgi:hypothetical protein
MLLLNILGYPEVSMTGIKSDLNVTLRSVGPNIYKASYTPDSTGVYLLNVMWAERLVNESNYFCFNLIENSF